MNPTSRYLFSAMLALLLLGPAFTQAAVIICEGEGRAAALTSAEVCKAGSGHAPLGGPWSNQGTLTANGTDGYLSALVMFEPDPYIGKWAIAQEFWNIFEDAVIAIHVGRFQELEDIGQLTPAEVGIGDPGYFAWLVTPGETLGMWAFKDFLGQGGLINIELWGRGEARAVPEPGTIALLSVGLLAFGTLRRNQPTEG